MKAIDQLGLFGSSPKETVNNAIRSPRKLSLTVEFSNLRHHTLEEILRKITKDIELLDKNASIAAQIDEEEDPWFKRPFFAIDVETTGLDAAHNRIIELALVPFNMPSEVKPFCQLFSVGEPLSQEIIQITGISDSMLSGMPAFKEHTDDFLKMMKHASFLLAYNAKFDRPFLESELARVHKVLPTLPWIDPFVFVCELDRFKRGKKLSDAAKRWGVNLENAHRARADAEAAGHLMLKMADKIDCYSLNDLLSKQKIFEWNNAHNMVELKRANAWAINR